jgi:hypothetical protein
MLTSKIDYNYPYTLMQVNWGISPVGNKAGWDFPQLFDMASFWL